MGALDRLAYGATQGLRVSWYYGQKMLAARLSESVPPPPELRTRMPETGRILRDLRLLLRRDLRNIELGYYALPDFVENPASALDTARRFFADLRRVEARRKAGDNSEIFRSAPPGTYPRYYLQNFHYQTDGYLSKASAELYDHQVEVLFGGAAGPMRRQALVPLHDEVEKRGVRGTRLIDIGCGTGRFLREVKHNYPRLAVTALDMSPYYLDATRRNLAPWSGTEFLPAAAESIPVPDSHFDIATCIYVFHELPAKKRREIAGEIHRILKPGGLFILVDSLQLGDEPDYDPLLEHFPMALHEPYYANYVQDDLITAIARKGFTHQVTDFAYFSKVMSFRAR